MTAAQLSAREIRRYYETRTPTLKLTDAKESRGPCPIHNGQRDSFAVNNENGDWYCHSQCKRGGTIFDLETALTGVNGTAAYASVMRIVGRKPAPQSRVVGEYNYTDENGKLLYQILRYEPKNFKVRRPDDKGGWIWNKQGIRLVLYNLPAVIEASTVYVCEGEKDAIELGTLGVTATSNPFGAGKWRKEYSESLRGKQVYVIPDDDQRGREHASGVIRSLRGVAASVALVKLPDAKDASEWIKQRGGTLEELKAMALCANVDFAQAPEAEKTQGTTREEPPQAEVPTDWPEPQPLAGALPPVEAFDPELLPVSLRGQAEDVADRMQVPLDFSAVPLVLCLAGVTGRRATVQPKAKDGSFVVVPNLWGGIVGRSGLLKTPALQAVLRALHHIQKLWREEYASELESYEQEKAEADLRFAAWKDRFKQHVKSGKGEAPIRPDNSLLKPTLKRLLTNDASFESLHERMAENPAGILLYRDELAGLLARIDQEEFANERAFLLTAWNGSEPYTIDRISRGTIHVEACCLAILGGLQPGRLRTYLADALADGPSNDGLIQRFQLLVWPDQPSTWRYVDAPPNVDAEQKVTRVFQEIVKLDPEACERLRFAPAAQEMFVAWLSQLEGRLRGNTMHPALEAHLSKYRKLMPALALLFELADAAASGTWTERVSLAHAQQAAAGCDYLESHAHRIYSCIASPQLRAAQTLGEKIREKKIGGEGTLSIREVYLKGWSGLDTPETARAGADILEDAGWLRSMESASRDKWGRGRPANKYLINPKVWTHKGETKV